MVALNRLDWQPRERRVIVLVEPPRARLVWFAIGVAVGVVLDMLAMKL